MENKLLTGRRILIGELFFTRIADPRDTSHSRQFVRRNGNNLGDRAAETAFTP